MAPVVFDNLALLSKETTHHFQFLGDILSFTEEGPFGVDVEILLV